MTKTADPKALCDHIDKLKFLSVGAAAAVIEGYWPEPGHEPPPESYFRQTELKHWLLERHGFKAPGKTLPKKDMSFPKDIYRQFCEERGVYPAALFPERRSDAVRRQRDVEQDAKDVNRIRRVLKEAEKVAKPRGPRSLNSISSKLDGTEGFKSETIRKILGGRYKRMRELRITSPYATGNGKSDTKK